MGCPSVQQYLLRAWGLGTDAVRTFDGREVPGLPVLEKWRFSPWVGLRCCVGSTANLACPTGKSQEILYLLTLSSYVAKSS